MSDFRMPALGADMEKATLVEWRVAPGSHVRKGEIVAVVETHKGAIEIEVFEDGVVRELVVPVGTAAPVGAVLARIDGAGAPALPPSLGPSQLAAPPSVTPRLRVAPQGEAAKKISGFPQPEEPPGTLSPGRHEEVETRQAAGAIGLPPAAAAGRARVSPAARRRAEELGVDVAALAGTGVDGAVTLADVELAGTRKTPAAPGARRGAFDPAEMRRAIGAAMSRSKREIPHYYLGTMVDCARALAWLDAYNAARPPRARMLPAVLLLKAVALALRTAPQLNGFWEKDGFRPGPGIHIGWAIALRGGGLIAPALHAVDSTPLAELMQHLSDLVGRARNGGLRGSELSDPTITVSSLGDRGADTLLPVIYPPQVAIIGFGRIATRPAVVEGRIEPRPTVAVSLAADHRASDGHLGGLFLAALERRLQEPEAL